MHLQTKERSLPFKILHSSNEGNNKHTWKLVNYKEFYCGKVFLKKES